MEKLFLVLLFHLICIPIFLHISLVVDWKQQNTNKFTESGSGHFENTQTCKFYGYWDHLQSPDNGKELLNHVNIGKGMSAWQARDILKQGIKAIPSMAVFDPEDDLTEIRRKLRGHARVIHSLGAEKIPFVFLDDEPYLGGFTLEQLELIIREAKLIIGDQFRYAMTFTRSTILYSDRKIPQNLDVVGMNFYPFKETNNIRKKASFDRELTANIKAARKKAPDAKFFITGQAFYGRSFIEPPVESPLWYAEIVQNEPDILGLLWYEYSNWRKNERFTETEFMPDLFEKQKEAFKMICP